MLPDSTSKTFNLVIVRHGQTIANLEKVIQGHCDTPLTELGLNQAVSLAKYFAQHNKFTKIYSSDLNRALETCKIIAYQQQHLNLNAASKTCIRKDARLRERAYGSFENLPIAKLQSEAYEHGFNEFNFTQYSPQGVEPMSDVIARVESFCQDTLFEQAQDGDEILIVTHWATIKEFFKLFQPFAAGCIEQKHLRETPNVAFNKFQISVAKLNFSKEVNNNNNNKTK